jgi:hypothetical protein
VLQVLEQRQQVDEGVIDMALPVRRRQRPDLTRWDPVTDVDRLRSQIEALFSTARRPLNAAAASR